MEYSLINPSDPYTFIAADKEIAALVVAIINPAYGGETEDHNEEMRIPIFIFGGFEEWYQDEFGRAPKDGLIERKADVAQALDSFMLGGFRDRTRYTAALEAIDDPEKRKAFIEKWNDGRTSLNNISSFAHSLSEQMRG
ncbi:MAG: hypothetical protein E7322_05725 [Clostridiales bacterium]|nr:hypothetical protein [Clostridiales bacterium]